MKIFYYYILLFLYIHNNSIAQNKVLSTALSKSNLAYIENKGQWDEKAKFLTRINGADAWVLNDGGILLDFYKITPSTIINKSNHKIDNSKKDDTIKGHRIYFKWINGNDKLVFKKLKKHKTYYNYLIGTDVSKHTSNVGLFEELTADNLYNGIDIKYYHSNATLRYDLIVKPNADPSQIKIQLNGAIKINKDENGNIILHTTIGDMSMQDLYVYEKESSKQIDCNWVVNKNNELTLSIGSYNKTNTLIIDPLIYSTYIGGSNYEMAEDVAVNNIGEAFITGSTQSPNFDFTVGGYQTMFNGIWDCFISKINSTGGSLIYSTFIGGSSSDMSNSIVVDKVGNSYITGATSSTNYYVTAGAYQTTQTNGDVFVSKLNSSGTALIYSTYIGGTDGEVAYSITIDAQDNAYITGVTTSLDYDVSSGAFQIVHSGGIEDAFITKLNPIGSTLVYSTLLGGFYRDCGYSITIDSLKNAYVTGYTHSADFPTTVGAFQTLSTNSNVMYNDIFLTKINANGTNLLYSTFIGGSDGDVGTGIEVDIYGNAYIAGISLSIDFPVTSGVVQSTIGGTSDPDCVIVKVNPSGNSLVFSTYFGGINFDRAMGIALDHNLDILITGYTASANLYTTVSALQPSITGFGNSDAFLTKINNAGTIIMYSTFLGGSMWDESHDITIDSLDKIYLTGMTESTNFPVTSGVYQPNLQGTNYDAFITKIGICPVINFSITSTNIICNGNSNGTATINLPGSALGCNFSWMPVGSSSISISGLSLGTYSAIVTDSTGCSTTKTVNIVQPIPVLASIIGTTSICSSQSTTLLAGGGTSYLWSNGAISNLIIVSPTITTNYSVIVSTGSCSDTSYLTLNVIPSPIATISGNDSICNGQNTLLTVSGSTNVVWSNGLNTNTIVANPTITSNYSVIVSNTSCADTANIIITVLSNPIATISGNDSICSGQNTILVASGGSNYSWSSGASTNSISVSPSATSNYSVLVSNANCVDTAMINLQVFQVPVASISGVDSICLAQSTILTAGGIGNYIWSNFSTNFNTIIVTPTINTTYTLIVSNSVCSDTAQKIITVNPLPIASITGTNSLCSGQTATLTANGGVAYNWNIGNVNSSISISPINTTNYSVMVTNTFGCQSSAYTTVTVIPMPTASIGGDTVICAAQLVSLSASGVGAFLWNTGETTSVITPSPINNTMFYVTASNVCGAAIDSMFVIVNPLPVGSASNDTIILIDNSISLYAFGGDNYLWQPANLSCNTCSVVNVSPNATTVYTVTISSIDGCSISKEIKVTVESDFEVFIPDVFSPNGDGQNDILFVRGIGIVEMSFKVYDRLGEKIFDTNDMTKGWDGTYKGNLLNNAVFVYELSATLVNGNKISKHGDVTLIR